MIETLLLPFQALLSPGNQGMESDLPVSEDFFSQMIQQSLLLAKGLPAGGLLASGIMDSEPPGCGPSCIGNPERDEIPSEGFEPFIMPEMPWIVKHQGEGFSQAPLSQTP